MSRNPISETLRVKRPFGLTLGMTSIILLFFVTIGEVLARSEFVRSTLTAPSFGSDHRGFEEQLSRLQVYASDRPSIDCIFLGDSTVMTDFAPTVFNRAYRQQTGQKIDCFNFGIGATNVVSSAAIAKILSEEYKPRHLIYGLQALNFAIPDEGAGIENTPWIRYRLGQPSIKGWLFDVSYLFRYLGAIRQVIRLDAEPSILRAASENQSGLQNGYYPMRGPRALDVSKQPNEKSKHPYDQNYFYHLGTFQILPENLEALGEILALNGNSARILVIEMPVANNFLYYFGNGEQDLRTFIDSIEQRVSSDDIPFWETSRLQMFSDDLWFNYNHLSPQGAEIFSQWLGTKLGKSALEES